MLPKELIGYSTPFQDSGIDRNFERVHQEQHLAVVYAFCGLGMYCIESLLCSLWCS